VVATWSPAAASTYYTRQRETEYYAGGNEPDGRWYAPARDFGIVDGSSVERRSFERLYDALDANGHPLLDQSRRHRERTPAFDVTLSAPRSVALLWAFASSSMRRGSIVVGSELPIDRQHDDLTFPREQRRVWLAECPSRASPKISTLDLIEGPQAARRLSKRVRDRGRESSYER
jgi:hypothetical protein